MIRAALQVHRGGFTLDLSFESNAPVTGVFGPSGCGKSTLIHTIAGLVQPAHGSIITDDQTLFDSAHRINVPAHRRNLGVVFQEDRLFPHLSVESNLLYGCTSQGLAWFPTRRTESRHAKLFAQVVEMLEIAPLLKRRPRSLSGGERQRVALGRALMSQPRLLMLDEPLSSLDRRLKQQIIPYLQRVRDTGMVPMLYVSHDLTELLQLTDRLLLLEHGRLAGHGRYMDLLHEHPALAVVHDRGMGNVLSAQICSHDEEQGVSMLALTNADPGALNRAVQLVSPRVAAEVGAHVTIAFSAWEVALALREVHGISIQNQLPGTVVRCTYHEHRAVVEVNVGQSIVVELSRPGAASLNLKPGQSVICLIKSHAIQYVGRVHATGVG